ncbi:MAG: anti-sigma factor antagonist [Dehalococcoidia bacterium]|nr:anti-sigma factor antagonist [Dehalococcoidia bacterium]
MQLSSLNESTSVITLDAFINAESEDALFAHLTEALQRGKDKVVLDFRPVDHMNSAGVSAFVKLTATAKQNGVKLFAYGLNKRYVEILALTGLDEGITVLDAVYKQVASLTQDELAKLEKMDFKAGEHSDAGWAPKVHRLHVSEKPEGAFARNMDGRRIIGQLQGFGPMWEKTYWIKIEKPGIKKEDVILAMQEHFVEFQPSENSFYPTSKGIVPGELIFIDSITPGGIVSTGVMVLYMDDRSFTFITPQGHPEAGWVTFSVDEREDSVYVQIQGLVRSSDPFFEIAFTMAGSKFQETIWTHVLSSLARYLGVEGNVQLKKYRPAIDLQWSKSGNIWYNSQIRSLPLNITTLFKRRR